MTRLVYCDKSNRTCHGGGYTDLELDLEDVELVLLVEDVLLLVVDLEDVVLVDGIEEELPDEADIVVPVVPPTTVCWLV